MLDCPRCQSPASTLRTTIPNCPASISGLSGTYRTPVATPRYIYWVPEGRGFGRWTRYDFLALLLMIRGVLSPGSETLADR